MKKALILSVMILTICCCTGKKATADSQTTNAVENDSIKTVEGKVLAITPGKDGYTAQIQSDSGIYFVTISHSNFKAPNQYKSVKVGDKLKVSGDFWQMENENHITVREIL